ncbi:MAG: RluA family pseudouridine synthase [Clostridia bacterium]|nr:RluA family pseudouridine synthase [Clostridia bacterium]
MNPLTYTVPESLSGCPVRQVLLEQFAMSHSHISRLKRRDDGICLNGQKCYTTTRCASGDTVSALISDPPSTKRLEPIEYPLDIVFEDEWLIVVNKPAGMTVHPERTGIGGSVENALTHYLSDDEFVHTVSRLDRGTSGLMTVAKCGYMHERMIRILHTDDFQKEYLAIVWGTPTDGHGFITLPLAHPIGENYRMEVRNDGLACKTEYEVVAELGDMSVVRLIPHTGRMHQLRVHMASTGHPIVGDWLYGQEVPFIDHPALHSAKLSFKHPLTRAYIKLTAPVPDDFEKIVSNQKNIWNLSVSLNVL